MNSISETEQRLWDYLDGLGTAAERSAVEALIASSPEWQTKYAELQSLIAGLESQELEEPSMRFTKNVMEEIARYSIAPATRTYVNKKIIRAIGTFFLLTIGAMLIYILTLFQWSFGNNPQPAPLINLNLEKINPGKLLNSSSLSVFIGVTGIVGLIFMDRLLRGRLRNKSFR